MGCKEEVLDITALHRDFIYNDNFASRLQCHGPSDRKIAFDYSIKEVDFANFTRHPEPINGTYYLALSRHQWAQARTNMFWCLVDRSTLSNVGSPAMFYGPNANPTFLPQKYTVTASLHDSVTLRVQAVPGESATPSVQFWARVTSAGKPLTLTTQSDPSQWNITTVNLYHSGVYIPQGRGFLPGKRRGIFRVIVRTCPHGIYGPSCNLTCPVCQNGGVCHDITGTCICPPGFGGQTCEKPCGDDYFGRKCQHRCSDTNQDKNAKSCRGILMCLPDPYGCSCGTGFHGPFCNETCPPNFYGADCKQSRKCFCKTKQFCDIYTGTCRQDNGTCLQGWKNGPYCNTSYPLLRRQPLVSGISDKEAIIQFYPWTKNRDDGEGQPKEYRIEFKVANETWSTQTVTVLPEKQVYNHTLTGLRSGTDYQVRVLVVDTDGNYREHGAVVAMFRTACGSPKIAPHNVTFDNSSTSEIVVKWKNPGREQWSCWSVSVILEVDGKNKKEFNLTQSGSTSVEKYGILVEPYTRVIIRLSLRTPNDQSSPWTQKYNITSAEAAPSMVSDVQIKKAGAREALLAWRPPQKANGYLRRYLVLYKPLAFRIRDCPQYEQIPTEVPVDASLTTVNLTALRPYTKYEVSVAAETILRGRSVSRTFLTIAAVPEAEPSNFHHSRTEDGYYALRWLPVPCDFANGASPSYYLELKSNNPWDSKEREETVPSLNFQYQDLVPYTQYEAKVFAQNEAGRSPKHASLNFRTEPAGHFRIAHTFNAKLTESWKPNPTTLDATESTEFDLQDLFPGSTYEVCIKASTSAGFGEASCGNFSTKASAPVVQMVPSVAKNINNTVSIVLTAVDSVGGPITGYFLLVVRERASIDEQPKLVNFSSAQEQRLGYYVAAHFAPNQLDKGPINFLVGGGSVMGNFENPPLTDTTPYRFALVAESNYSGDVLYGYRVSAPVVAGAMDVTNATNSTFTLYAVNSSGGAAGVGAIIGVIAVVLCLIIMAVSATYYYRRKKHAVAYRSKTPSMSALKGRLSRLSKLKESMPYSPCVPEDSSEYVDMACISNRCLQSLPVSLQRLQQHLSRGQTEGFLREEYMSMPKGQLHSWNIAAKPQNKPKNREEHVLPYDHSRVLLVPLSAGDSTDYINANYVQGYKFPGKYIATQGPKASTLTDFWHMVWQEGACKVVMLTNLTEHGVTKCEQYWPETSQKYGNFMVTLMNTDTQVDFVVREFQLTLDDKTRTIVHFHFTAWPDHGVPQYPDALWPFLKRIRDFQPLDHQPVIVHCSDGMGRTGAFILVDSMLSQAEAEGEVNLVAHLYAMRQNRVDLVESPEQYIFAYKVLVEILCSKKHKLSIGEIFKLYPKLKAKFPGTGKSAIDLEFEDLKRICLLPGTEDFRSARDAENASKNRSSKILARDSRRPLLRATSDGSKTDYINAVYVDGFKRRNAYLVTQMPLQETIDDFWEMIAGSRADTLVTLGPLENETVTPKFWPDLKCAARYGDVTVEQKNTQDFQDLVVRTFFLTQSSGPPRIVKQFHFESWQMHPSVPSSATIILDILEHVERWQMQGEGTPFVVQCLDGCQASGLYCVSAAICDQLKLEKELDVFSAVRNVRASRVEFIVDS
ncbi:receptor-type tyrosine-protein phosphatase T-like [Haemaphysalis longicornis]